MSSTPNFKINLFAINLLEEVKVFIYQLMSMKIQQIQYLSGYGDVTAVNNNQVHYYAMFQNY
jgi:hypothetical protein